ncbi:integrating conjugative element protein [Saezia sanguinis]|uniref:integrating conjugative element protein n=1 Tax=Saezia sanguinis TaxID=1965230 RepID=UPI00303EAD6B
MKHFCLSLLLLLSVTCINAQSLTVVGDYGGRSALHYFDAIGIVPDTPAPASSHQPAQVFRADESFVLPISSKRLTPGPVTPRRINAPGLLPFFLIGDDELSRKWLKERSSMLRELGVFGLVVNVDSMDSLSQLRQLAPEIILSPIPGDDLAARLQLSHYPVLITSSSIEQ